jgi:hypothetical protein|tara:strand:+ start:802 stop:1068 length:267 start_codon:yes stop_codon:yes gene_type:complete
MHVHISKRKRNSQRGIKRWVINTTREKSAQVVRRKNFATRDEAVAYARQWIKANEQHTAIQRWRFENRDENGLRRTADEAIAALGLGK